MKTTPLLFICFLLLVTHSNATPVSAKTAHRLFSQAVGADVSSRIVSISGHRGQEHPQTWLFTVRNAQGGLMEYNMTETRFIGHRQAPAAVFGQPLSARQWKIDSTAAFLTVEKIARQSKVGFDHVNYKMRCLEASSQPAWFITLVGANNLKVGEITISATTGAVLQQLMAKSNIAAPNVTGPPAGPASYFPPTQNSHPSFWNKTKSAAGSVSSFLARITGRQPPQQQPYYQGQPAR